MRVCLLIAVVAILSSCYTRKQAMSRFGCQNVGISKDSVLIHVIDSDVTIDTIPGDTITVNGPCEEITAMSPGESVIKRGIRTGVIYGKDSSGRSYVRCLADLYMQKMTWYKEQWQKSVFTTIHQVQKDEKNWWQRMQSMKVEMLITLLIGFGLGVYLVKK